MKSSWASASQEGLTLFGLCRHRANKCLTGSIPTDANNAEKSGWIRKHLAARSRRILAKLSERRRQAKAGLLPGGGERIGGMSPEIGLVSPGKSDAENAEATSDRALTVVLERVRANNDRADDFVTDAYATVGVAYHRAAGLYSADRMMQKLGTAAVHLLTMATSYSASGND